MNAPSDPSGNDSSNATRVLSPNPGAPQTQEKWRLEQWGEFQSVIYFPDGRTSDPMPRAEAQGFVDRHNASIDRILATCRLLRDTLEKAPNPHTCGVSDLAHWTRDHKEPALRVATPAPPSATTTEAVLDAKDDAIVALFEIVQGLTTPDSQVRLRAFKLALESVGNPSVLNGSKSDDASGSPKPSLPATTHGETETDLGEKEAARRNTLNLQMVRFTSSWFVYLVIFLRNAGERTRAIKLACSAFGIGVLESRDWVDSVKLIQRPIVRSPEAERIAREYPTHLMAREEGDTEQVASHWPPSVERQLKQRDDVENGSSALPHCPPRELSKDPAAATNPHAGQDAEK